MKDFNRQFGELLEQQKLLTKHYEEVISDYQKSEVSTENIILKKDLEALKIKFEALEGQHSAAQKEIEELKGTLREQIISERTQLLASAKQKREIYFKRSEEEVVDKLTALEQSSAIEIQKVKNEFTKKLGADYKKFEEELRGIQYKLNEKFLESTGELAAKKEELSKVWNRDIEELQSEQLTPEMLQKRIRQNNIEVKIGLNWISKIGVFLILIGVIAAMKYSYSLFTAGMKGIFGMLVGLGFLGIGEYFNREKKLIFGTALTGGGIGVLYLTIFWSYFVLDILSLTAALILSVLLSITAFLLSIRYHSKTIGAFGLIGGYLPLLSYIAQGGLKGDAIYIAMGYVFVLNLATLLIAVKKNWAVLRVMSYVSHFPILLYLTFNADSGTAAIAYSLIVFGMYLTMTLMYPFRFKEKLDTAKIIFLGTNTFLGCTVTYALFEHFMFDEYRGILAFAFCAVYWVLALLFHQSAREEKTAALIFEITALTFAVLIVPFQFGMNWIVLGWFIEGTLLMLFRKAVNSKTVERGGRVIFALCIGSFVILSGYYQNTMIYGLNMLDINYFVITLGAIVVMISYLREARKSMGEYMTFYAKGKCITAYKYGVLLNSWIYLNYLANRIYAFLGNGNQLIGDGDRFLIFAVITVALAYSLPKIGLLRDRMIKYVSMTMLIIVSALCIFMNLSPQFIDESSKGLGITVLIVYNILVLFITRDILKDLIKTEGMNAEGYPMIMAIYVLFNTTVLLKMQLDIGYVDFIISIFYIISAFILIILGFKLRYRYIRYGGLGLAVSATAKLFLYDARGLWEQYRIVSYFCFGLVLLGISYLYQRFAKVNS